MQPSSTPSPPPRPVCKGWSWETTSSRGWCENYRWVPWDGGWSVAHLSAKSWSKDRAWSFKRRIQKCNLHLFCFVIICCGSWRNDHIFIFCRMRAAVFLVSNSFESLLYLHAKRKALLIRLKTHSTWPFYRDSYRDTVCRSFCLSFPSLYFQWPFIFLKIASIPSMYKLKMLHNIITHAPSSHLQRCHTHTNKAQLGSERGRLPHPFSKISAVVMTPEFLNNLTLRGVFQKAKMHREKSFAVRNNCVCVDTAFRCGWLRNY